MVERVRDFGVDDVIKYVNPLMHTLSIERDELRNLRLPVPEDIDKFGILISFRGRKQKMLEEREKAVIEQLKSLALAHGLHEDKRTGELVGTNGEKINKENFTIIKGFVLQFLDKKMIEESIRMKESGNPYGGSGR